MPVHRETIVPNMFNVQLTFVCYLWSMQQNKWFANFILTFDCDVNSDIQRNLPYKHTSFIVLSFIKLVAPHTHEVSTFSHSTVQSQPYN